MVKYIKVFEVLNRESILCINKYDIAIISPTMSCGRSVVGKIAVGKSDSTKVYLENHPI